MNSLDRYLFRQMWSPLVFTLGVTTAIVWVTQSLQRVDLVVDHGGGWLSFGWLTLLLIPSLLSVIIPFAVFAAVMFALQRLRSDSEIAVMFAAGVSRGRIGAPVLALSTLGALATLVVNLDLMPRSYRVLKQEIASIRADLASSIVRDGEFTRLSDGFTIYVDRVTGPGRFQGVLINDFSDETRPTVYLAQRAAIRSLNGDAVLQLLDGSIQTEDETGTVNIVDFSATTVKLDAFRPQQDRFELEATERYLGELLHPDTSQRYDQDNYRRLVAEGHARLASPLYVVTYALIALGALVGGAQSRRGYGARIVGACAAVGALRITGFVAQGAIADSGQNWLIYAIPATPAIVAAAFLLGVFGSQPIGARPR